MAYGRARRHGAGMIWMCPVLGHGGCHVENAGATDSDPRCLAAACRCLATSASGTSADSAGSLSAPIAGPGRAAQIYVKRDDMTGVAFGGNKMRLLEFMFAEIQRAGADAIVAGAYTQSNLCRQITASACKLGLPVSLVLLHGEKGPCRTRKPFARSPDGRRRDRGRSRHHGKAAADAGGKGGRTTRCRP